MTRPLVPHGADAAFRWRKRWLCYRRTKHCRKFEMCLASLFIQSPFVNVARVILQAWCCSSWLQLLIAKLQKLIASSRLCSSLAIARHHCSGRILFFSDGSRSCFCVASIFFVVWHINTLKQHLSSTVGFLVIASAMPKNS